MQMLEDILADPLAYHIDIQGKLVYTECLNPMPMLVARNMTSMLPSTTIVTGGTKGLGLEYIKEVSQAEPLTPLPPS